MKRQLKLQKEWRTIDGESDWGMISRVTSEERRAGKGRDGRKSQILRDGEEVRRRWAEYFELVLNMADVKQISMYSWQLEDVGVGRFE